MKIYNVGTNDLKSTYINGKRCKYYVTWKSMLQRCYSLKYKKKNPTYSDCSVCDEWLTFSNFKSWMIKQDWQGKDLDKDILVQGNKIYSPETCFFISRRINTLLNISKKRIGNLPIGVTFNKKTKKYNARCRVGDKRINIGYFDCYKKAHEEYKKFKFEVIRELAEKEKEPIKSALLSYIAKAR